MEISGTMRKDSLMDVLCLTALRDCPDRLDEAACWFHEKWGIPAEVYRDSIRQ